ncbi:arginyltransferase [Gimibacter soli]|uniref:Aspartate/glutamate leucyltransferase n=1 Tax=Gimibacter soli TaxID=3024400 RepID=A0AAE9XSW7_9PROT|nr:arginyltransferase [Gimibacter soli]WCL55751.1 arginyltransferase [Gimibacter soli]
MTDQSLQFPKFFVTAPAPCPYLSNKVERKVFTELIGPEAGALNEALGRVGFRRSQSVVYRPACENCSACVSVRVRALEHSPAKSERRTVRRNADLTSEVCPPIVTEEQFSLLSSYLQDRHSDGSMAGMGMPEYIDMVETSPVTTVLIEYRRMLDRKLMAVALTDELSDGLSMVYSFFDTEDPGRSLGTYIIADHIARARTAGLPYVYLGYWVEGSGKMAYKRRFKPLERLGTDGWSLMP